MPSEAKSLPSSKSASIAEIAKVALEDLFFFNQYILGNAPVMNEELHREMCDFATSYREFAGGKKKKLILEPRGSLKSTCVTVAYALQLMLKNPDIRILIDSEKQTNSKSFLASIQGVCETNEKYRALARYLYGVDPSPKSKNEEKWAAAEITIPMRKNRTLKEPTISCGGVDVVKVGQHYDVIIMDDPVSDNNTTTREQIQKVINHYKLSLSLLDPGGITIIIGTRWDFGDLYGWIIENQKDYFDILIRSAHKPDGSLLYPERLTEEFLAEFRHSQGPFMYSCQYENNPVPRDEATFRFDRYTEWVGEYRDGKIIIEELRYYTGENTYEVKEGKMTLPVSLWMTVDPATSLTERADPTGIIIGGVDEQKRLFIIDFLNKRVTGQAFWDEIFRLVQTYHPRRVGIETVAFQKSLQQNAIEEMGRRGVYFRFQELKADQDKVRRVNQLQARYEARALIVRAGMDELKYQMVNFPRTPHDDLVDALAYQLQFLRPTIKSQVVKQPYQFRSAITRY